MSGTPFYRVDRRDLSVGDVVATAGEFSKLNPAGSSDVERIFEERRPGHLVPRTQCLFVFESIAEAKKHWCKMTGGNLYQVAIEPEDFIFKADMALIDAAFVCRHQQSDVTNFAVRYWAGEAGPKPVFEIMAKKAVVTGILSKDQAARKEYFKLYATGRLQNEDR